MNKPQFTALAFLVFVTTSSLCLAQEGATEPQRRVDSRSTFVHRINIWDESGLNINVKDENPKPYSPSMTCGRCHPTSLISHGLHFNATDPSVAPGRPGEPWIFLDATTRTQLPISHRTWKGTWRPADIGLTDWSFTLQFGRHLPGGGPGLNPTTRPADPKARWQFSGQLENDCMICHSADNTHDPAERARQVELFQNLKWAPSVAMGLAAVNGAAKTLKLDDDDDDADKTAAAGKAKAIPTLKMVYDKARFDAEGKILFNVVRKPPADRCYYCHTSLNVSPAAPPAWQHDGDIHLRKGLSCNDCHRHGIDHAVTRNYEGEATDRNDPSLAVLSCRGCHLGAEGASVTGPLGGKLGSPRPAHKGLPPLHLEKLSCTACHSGPWPSESLMRVQTSMAHALGLEKPTRKAESLPAIVEPVFRRTAPGGQIAPYRTVWPNFWGRIQGGSVMPITPAQVKTAAKEILPAVRETEAAASTPLTDEQISGTLAALGSEGGEAVYISGERLWHRLPDGKLGIVPTPPATVAAAAFPYSWPIAHDVRPASQALGVRGCTDCHSSSSSIFFGQVAAVGPVQTERAVVWPMHRLRGESGFINRIWPLAFAGRTLMKIVVFACAGVLAAVLLLYGFKALGGVLSRDR
jgi:hypothetical protein